jgi:predicted O-methyltransferase YrrM
VEFERRIEELDLSLFRAISSESSDGDKTSWLALQRALRRSRSPYHYLEIGSHLGGSIQQHLVDPKCDRIYSIDKRPAAQPDDRGMTFFYEGNSTERMLQNLRSISADAVPKVVCFDADARDIDPASIDVPPQFCFIDGEHTKEAVLKDFEFCLQVCDPDAIIAFHDDFIIFPALAEMVKRLDRQAIPFRAAKLKGVTFAIFLRQCPLGPESLPAGLAVEGRRWLRYRRLGAFAKRWLPSGLVPFVRRLGNWIIDRDRRRASRAATPPTR